MLAGKLTTWTGATKHRFGGIGKVSRRTVVLSTAPSAIAEQQGAVRGTEQPYQLSFQHDSTRILYRGCVRRQGIRVSLINLHVQETDSVLLNARASPITATACWSIKVDVE